ncbi:MAG: hypothetical protein Q8R44_18795 [Novosphingobium sp.]|nr:hypothetical protein [Novosphingobium sp.]
MTDHSDESVIAYVDGRMEGAERIAFEANMGKDATLSECVGTHRWLVRQIVAAYPEPIEEGDEQELADRLGLRENNVRPISSHREPRQPWGWAWIAGAMAASLVIGLFVGQSRSSSTDSLIALSDGRPIASGSLADSLSNRLSGENGAIRIAMTFRTRGGVCRTFQTSQNVGGVACRDGSRWVIPVMEATKSSSDSTEYRLAAGALSPSLMARVDQMIVGEPLGPKEVAGLKRSNWR